MSWRAPDKLLNIPPFLKSTGEHFEHSGDPVDALIGLYGFLRDADDSELPQAVKEWATTAIRKYLESDCSESLEQLLGLPGTIKKTPKHTGYFFELAKVNTFRQIQEMVDICNFPIVLACKLACVANNLPIDRHCSIKGDYYIWRKKGANTSLPPFIEQSSFEFAHRVYQKAAEQLSPKDRNTVNELIEQAERDGKFPPCHWESLED